MRPAGTLVADPVSAFAAATGDLAGVQACCAIRRPVPKLHQGVMTLCQSQVPLQFLALF